MSGGWGGGGRGGGGEGVKVLGVEAHSTHTPHQTDHKENAQEGRGWFFSIQHHGIVAIQGTMSSQQPLSTTEWWQLTTTAMIGRCDSLLSPTVS